MLRGCHDQFGQVLRAGNILAGKPGCIDVMGMRHAKDLRLDVHGGNKGGIAAGVVASQGSGGPVFRTHQGKMEQVAARRFCTDLEP